ncbi:MAG: FtsX-like permease family protein [Acidimicrobiia bacterium]
MRAAVMYARVTLRERGRSALVLALLVGLVGAFVIASFAGARRTASSFDRFAEETRAADLTVFTPELDTADLVQLRKLPGVEAIGLGKQLTALVNGGFGSVGGPLDQAIGRTVDRPRLVEGRRARENRVDEIVVPEQLALGEHLDVGGTITLHAFTPAQTESFAEGAEVADPVGPEVELRVVGISRAPSDLSIEGASGGLMFTTRAFVREYGDQIGSFAPVVLRVRVADDDAAARFVRFVRTRYNTPDSPGLFQVQPTSETEGAINQSIDVLATGLRVFAAIALLTGLVVIAVGSRRFIDDGAVDLPALRALGTSRAQRIVASGLPVAVMGVVGAAVAVIGAVLASPLMPVGLARKAEPDLGIDLDMAVLGIGFVAAVALVTSIGLLAAALADRAERATSEPARSSLLAVRAFDAGLTPPIAVGVTMALQPGRGRRSMPVRQGISAVVVAIIGTIAVVVFGTSLERLISTPAAYGYNWDAHTEFCSQGAENDQGSCTVARRTVADDRAVAAVSDVFTGTMEVEGHPITGTAFATMRGDIKPTVLEGRAPLQAGEVALGSETLTITKTKLGSSVVIVGDQASHSYLVVGSVALPVFTGSADPGDLQAIADGVAMTVAGFDRISDARSDGGRLVLRWRPGADRKGAIARLRGVTGPISTSPVPLEVERLEQVDELPWALGGFLASIGILGIAYVTVAGVRRRARDLAILKTIGFRRAQVGTTVATQASTLGVVGILIGIPLGLVVGGLVWDRVAASVGFASDPTIAALAVVAVVLGALVVVNVTAALPARRAARLRPATVLRNE